MASITTEVLDNKEVWEKFISSHPEANFLHSWYWGVFHEALNHRVVRIGIFRDGQLVGASQAIVEPARRGRHMVIPGGPIMDWQDANLTKVWLSAITRAAKQQQCIFVRVRPQLLDTQDNRRLFKKLGFHKSPMHVTADLTSQLYLSKSDEEIKHGMRKGARYDLNRAQKLNIKIEADEQGKYLDEFYQLQLETAKRHKFVPFSKKFLSEQFKAFAVPGKVVMYRSSIDGKLLAMAFIIFYGPEAAYHYGASTELARQYPAAYVLQWQAIAEARRRGCKRYNFWGVAEHGQTKHRFYGVSVFKRGFGGEDVAYLPARDLIINPLKYSLTYAFETGRRKIRHL